MAAHLFENEVPDEHERNKGQEHADDRIKGIPRGDGDAEGDFGFFVKPY
ncbi:hypothetical protein LJC41_04485 [Desulfosarcina sp. OttesenSCG-928-G17]|nr:hypothetical protein [Desulfosarcina sp. OttesenSCG-928-G17]